MMSDREYIEAAREHQREGTLEIDDGAVVSRGSDPGAYVQAWVWVEDPAGDASEDYNEDEEPEVKPAAAAVAPADLTLSSACFIGHHTDCTDTAGNCCDCSCHAANGQSVAQVEA